MFKVGIPAKSGVSGVIMIVIPNLCGIAIYSPPLDHIGNSYRGTRLAESLIKEFNLHNINFSKKKVDNNIIDEFIEASKAITNGDIY